MQHQSEIQVGGNLSEENRKTDENTYSAFKSSSLVTFIPLAMATKILRRTLPVLLNALRVLSVVPMLLAKSVRPIALEFKCSTILLAALGQLIDPLSRSGLRAFDGLLLPRDRDAPNFSRVASRRLADAALRSSPSSLAQYAAETSQTLFITSRP